MPVLGSEFFNQPCCELAASLLGKILVRQLGNGALLKGRIVETEAYPGGTDKASHTHKGKTPRNAAMFEKAGTTYVYLIYGMYHCLNFSAKEPGAGVLIRALEPLEGLDAMRELRKGGATLKEKELCNGPGRLSQAFDIRTSEFNMHDLTGGNQLWLENDSSFTEFAAVTCPRIGIDSSGAEWVQKPWRFYVLNSVHVSKRDKGAEAKIIFQDRSVASAFVVRKRQPRNVVKTSSS